MIQHLEQLTESMFNTYIYMHVNIHRYICILRCINTNILIYINKYINIGPIFRKNMDFWTKYINKYINIGPIFRKNMDFWSQWGLWMSILPLFTVGN